MNSEQRESLNRVRASYASMNDDDHELGVYRTADMEVVLNLLSQQQIVIDTVRDDLGDIREALETVPEPGSYNSYDLVAKMGLELVNSTLMFINEEKGIL